MENENQTPHKRRVHYKGKYPKKFEEKYKELQPEKYKDTIAHVIQKGNTPAGMHISIMVKEILDFLQIKPGQTGFDATLGYGGHTKAMLEQLQGQGHIHATDVDPAESAKTKKRLADQGFGEDMLTIHLQNFCTIDEIAKEVGGFDFILADLGVSSMQIDNPERGFSFKVDGPLDLRLNQEAGISAAERLDTISRDELAGMLYENSDEPYCEELAKAITDEIRKGHRVDTTTKLRRIIEDTLDFLPEKDKKEAANKIVGEWQLVSEKEYITKYIFWKDGNVSEQTTLFDKDGKEVNISMSDLVNLRYEVVDGHTIKVYGTAFQCDELAEAEEIHLEFINDDTMKLDDDTFARVKSPG